jgi:hypothetical protein
MDASAIIQNDARVENIRAMTEATLEYGVYPRGHSASPSVVQPRPQDAPAGSFVPMDQGRRRPGTCIAWSEKRRELPAIRGDERICQRIWDSIDALGNAYVWWIALAF